MAQWSGCAPRRKSSRRTGQPTKCHPRHSRRWVRPHPYLRRWERQDPRLGHCLPAYVANWILPPSVAEQAASSHALQVSLGHRWFEKNLRQPFELDITCGCVQPSEVLLQQWAKGQVPHLHDGLQRFTLLVPKVVLLACRSSTEEIAQEHDRVEQVGVRVRSHPDALIVTAFNKMRNAKEVEVIISYSECGAETPFLPRSTEISKKNLASVNQFLSGLAPAEMIMNKCFWRNVPASQIAGFLGGLDISSMNMPFMTDINGRDRPILSFIGVNGVEKLSKWDTIELGCRCEQSLSSSQHSSRSLGGRNQGCH